MIDNSLRDVVCPICSTNVFKIIKSEKRNGVNFQILQCQNKKCLHGFLWPLPTIEFLSSIYSNDESNDACDRNDEYVEQSSQHLSNIFKHCINPAFEKLSVLRLDGDMYSSTWEVLENLYEKLSGDGYLIIDDYGAVPGCKAAVNDFRRQNHIQEPIQTIDWTGVYWKK